MVRQSRWKEDITSARATVDEKPFIDPHSPPSLSLCLSPSLPHFQFIFVFLISILSPLYFFVCFYSLYINVLLPHISILFFYKFFPHSSVSFMHPVIFSVFPINQLCYFCQLCSVLLFTIGISFYLHL
jgi:hypothetical protein